jgi:hypothetical protein
MGLVSKLKYLKNFGELDRMYDMKYDVDRIRYDVKIVDLEKYNNIPELIKRTFLNVDGVKSYDIYLDYLNSEDIDIEYKGGEHKLYFHINSYIRNSEVDVSIDIELDLVGSRLVSRVEYMRDDSYDNCSKFNNIEEVDVMSVSDLVRYINDTIIDIRALVLDLCL